MNRRYQNVLGYGKHEEWNGSKFFNEGKWNNFIAPHLPEDCTDMTFLEIGSNYGLFLKMAKDREFRHVKGIDYDTHNCEIAKRYLGDSVEVERANVNESIYWNDFIAKLPATDYILLSNFHYHIYTNVFLHLINILRRKCRYIIIVSAEDVRGKLYCAKPHITRIRGYFRDWELVKHIPEIDGTGDPSPRRMYSLGYKSEIERVPIQRLIDALTPRGMKFYLKVRRVVRKTRIQWKYPQNQPLLLHPDYRLIDGHHRLACLEIDEYKSALCEVTKTI